MARDIETLIEERVGELTAKWAEVSPLVEGKLQDARRLVDEVSALLAPFGARVRVLFSLENAPEEE